MKKLSRKQKKNVRHLVCVTWAGIGFGLFVMAILKVLSIEDAIKYFDQSIFSAIVSVAISIVCGFIGFRMIDGALKAEGE